MKHLISRHLQKRHSAVCGAVCALLLFLSFRDGRASQHQADFDPGQRSGVQGPDADREQVIFVSVSFQAKCDRL